VLTTHERDDYSDRRVRGDQRSPATIPSSVPNACPEPKSILPSSIDNVTALTASRTSPMTAWATINGDDVTLTVKVRKENTEVASFTVRGNKGALARLAAEVVERTKQAIAAPGTAR